MKQTLYVTSYVYFIRPGDAPVVKIGSTISPLQGRLQALQTANYQSLHVLGAIDIKKRHGLTSDNRVELLKLAQAMERELHSTFAPRRIRGEWFHLTPELDQYIQLHTNVAVPLPRECGEDDAAM